MASFTYFIKLFLHIFLWACLYESIEALFLHRVVLQALIDCFSALLSENLEESGGVVIIHHLKQ